MKAFALSKNVVRAALVAGALMLSHGALASPDDGVRCATGFEPRFAGGALSCVKQLTRNIDNATRVDCPQDVPFTKFQRMAANQKDICVNPAINIPSDSSLANFENGQLVLTIPRLTAIPGGLTGRTPVRLNPDGSRVFRLNENADFIFFERSKTAQRTAEQTRALIDIATARSLNVPGAEIETKLVSVTSDIDALGSLDRVNINLKVFAFAKP